MATTGRGAAMFDRTLPPLSAEETLAGGYRLEREMGRGAIGALFAAQRAGPSRGPVLLEFLPGSEGRDPGVVVRARGAIERSRSSRHSAILEAESLAEDPRYGGVAFVVLERPPGRTLADAIAEEPLGHPLERVLSWAEPIAAALDELRARGSPLPPLTTGAVWIDAEGRARILGSGFAGSASPGPAAGEAREELRALANVLLAALSGGEPFAGAEAAEAANSPLGRIPARAREGLFEAAGDGGAWDGAKAATLVALLRGSGAAPVRRAQGGPPPAPAEAGRPMPRRRRVAVWILPAVTSATLLALWLGYRNIEGRRTAQRAREGYLRLRDAWDRNFEQTLAMVRSSATSGSRERMRSVWGDEPAASLDRLVEKAEGLRRRGDHAGASEAYARAGQELAELESARIALCAGCDARSEFFRAESWFREQDLPASRELEDARWLLAEADDALERRDWQAAVKAFSAAAKRGRASRTTGERQWSEREAERTRQQHAALRAQGEAGRALAILVKTCSEGQVAEGPEAEEGRRTLGDADAMLERREWLAAAAAYVRARERLDAAVAAAVEAIAARRLRETAARRREEAAQAAMARFLEAIREGGVAEDPEGVRGNEALEAGSLRMAEGDFAGAERAFDEAIRRFDEATAITRMPRRIHVDLGGEVRMELARVGPGAFWMGASPGDLTWNQDEHWHRVVITKPYYLGVTEVTQAQWRAVMGSNPSAFPDEDRPVESVSWQDAVAFCNRLSARTGARFRLPTEAEWEHACRAGSTDPRYGTLSAIAWHATNSAGKTFWVGRKSANAFGLHDMIGNVWEWCSDRYAPYPQGAPPARDPKGAITGSLRVIRGGSMSCDAADCRAAVRNRALPSAIFRDLGFRVAREP